MTIQEIKNFHFNNCRRILIEEGKDIHDFDSCVFFEKMLEITQDVAKLLANIQNQNAPPKTNAPVSDSEGQKDTRSKEGQESIDLDSFLRSVK